MQQTAIAERCLRIETNQDGFEIIQALAREADQGLNRDVTAWVSETRFQARTIGIVDYFRVMELDTLQLEVDYQVRGSPDPPQFLYLAAPVIVEDRLGRRSRSGLRLRIVDIRTLEFAMSMR